MRVTEQVRKQLVCSLSTGFTILLASWCAIIRPVEKELVVCVVLPRLWYDNETVLWPNVFFFWLILKDWQRKQSRAVASEHNPCFFCQDTELVTCVFTTGSFLTRCKVRHADLLVFICSVSSTKALDVEVSSKPAQRCSEALVSHALMNDLFIKFF